MSALKESIVAWKAKLTETDPDAIHIGMSSCPLCLRHYNHDCAGCPIEEDTGLIWCGNTPYPDANEALTCWCEGTGSRKDFVKAAKKMIKYMEKLDG